MIRMRTVSSIAAFLTWKGSMSMIGVAILLGMTSRERPGEPEGGPRPRPGRVDVQDDGAGQKVRASLRVAEGDASTTLVVHNERGREVLEVCLYKNQDILFRFGPHDPVRVSGSSGPDGGVGLVVDAARNLYQFDFRPDGTARVGGPGAGSAAMAGRRRSPSARRPAASWCSAGPLAGEFEGVIPPSGHLEAQPARRRLAPVAVEAGRPGRVARGDGTSPDPLDR